MNYSNTYTPQSIEHPGYILHDKLEEMQMGSKEFAIRVNKPEKTISEVLNGKSRITSDMAVAFENVTQIPADYWLRYQRAYDEFVSREKRQVAIEKASSWAKNFSFAQIANFGWVAKTTKQYEKTNQLLQFFGFAEHCAWEDYYLNRNLKVAFRISLSGTKNPYNLSAWLRRGDVQAKELVASEYSRVKFLESLPLIKNIMAKHPDNFFTLLQNICLDAGVKVVYTPCLPNAPIHGSTRWIGNTPLIQLSARYRRNDIFWFTFFHEAGHVLLHGKKDIFLEDIEYSEKDLKKEQEADDFAIEWTFSTEQENIIMDYIERGESLIPSVLSNFCKEFVTHEAMIVGRLQHKKVVYYNEGTQYFEKIDLSE